MVGSKESCLKLLDVKFVMEGLDWQSEDCGIMLCSYLTFFNLCHMSSEITLHIPEHTYSILGDNVFTCIICVLSTLVSGYYY